jgi:uncharacterized protein (TIGR02118 family)
MSAASGVRVSVFYDTGAEGRFDFDYYVQQHVPMVHRLMADQGCRAMWVERGIAGGAPGSPAPYSVVGHMEFASAEAFGAAMAAVGAEIQGDVPNYTDQLPTIQISEIVDVWQP